MIEFRKRITPSNAPGGYGTITRKGYRRISIDGRQWMEHVLVWEHYNGSVPVGMQVHHINENKLDNRIENLSLVDTLTHKRIHSGCELRDGEWFKPCGNCGTVYPITNYYERRDGVSSWCKPCCVENAIFNKRRRRGRLDTRGVSLPMSLTRLLHWNHAVASCRAPAHV